MIAKKYVTKDGEVRWEVTGWTSGRGSKYLRRRFERKVDADSFITDQKIQKVESANKPPSLFSMAERTFSDEARHWLDHRWMEFSPGHKKRAKDALEKQILPAIGHVALDKISPVLFSTFRIARLEEGLKPASVNRETEVMMAILNFSVKQRRIPYNPAAGFTKLDEAREDMLFWERAEASAFLSYTNKKYPTGSDQRWVFVAYLTMLNTAIRSGETWGLMPQDLVQGGELLLIRRQFDMVEEGLRLPKGQKARKVPCNSFLRAELMKLSAQRKLRPDQTYFCNQNGNPMNHDNFVSRHFDRDVVESGVKRIRPHDLRHTGTTLMIADGLDLKTVQEICGHEDIKTTMRYVHLLGESIKNAGRTFSVIPGLEIRSDSA